MSELYQEEIYQFMQHMKDRFNMEVKVNVTIPVDEHYSYDDIKEEQ
tara:strand:+ start:6897 stop:7034 length:138 start_codon:yes stop_codon:yes gene_type:complete